MTQRLEAVGSTQMTEQVELCRKELGQVGAREESREKTYSGDRAGLSDAERATSIGTLLITTGADSGGAGEAARAARLACEERRRVSQGCTGHLGLSIQ